ncbi:Rv3235 family protein [Pseudonocardia nantongensis]|uniref:Rv3235 family protein n=1 Tax=Pseudonocardia nantongensis TaxID=1181885 RepID=UPI003979D989
MAAMTTAASTVGDRPAGVEHGVTVLPGGVRMRAPGHEPPAVRLPVAQSPAPVAAAAPEPAPPPAAVPVDGTAPGAGGSVPGAPADRERVLVRASELVRTVTEVLAGHRPPGHLTGVATPSVLRYLTCARPGTTALRSRPAGRGGRAGVPGCTPPGARRRPRLHVGHPHPDAAEVCTTVLLGGRIRALALRLDRADADAPWAVTAARLL